MRVLFDTNILIEHLHGAPRVAPYFDAAMMGKIDIAISVITEYELLRYPQLDADEELAIAMLLAHVHILTVGRRTAQIAATLARRYQRLMTADGLIAATALEHSIPLLTRNTRDFKYIKEIALWTDAPPSAS